MLRDQETTLVLGLYVVWNLRTERIKCSHARQSKECPVLGDSKGLKCYMKHE